MIKYTLNVELRFQKNSLRLKDNMKWEECENPLLLKSDDYFTHDPDEIIKLEILDYNLEWKGKKYLINSTSGISISDESIGFYEVYCFRDTYPEPPLARQLKEVLFNGDDTIHNFLMLDVYGKFSLVDADKVNNDKILPHIVFQNECFVAGNQYVGNTIDDELVEEIFRTNLYYWKEHLLYKKMHEQDDTNYGIDVEDIFDIYDELDKIKKEYT